MPKHCEACKIDLIDDYAFQGHITGKKHAHNLRLLELKKSIEERSIFVSNWPPFINKAKLFNFFLQYGEIETHKFEPGYAFIQFTTKAPVDFLTRRPIFISNYKLRIKPRIFHNTFKAANSEVPKMLSYNDFKDIFEGETTFDSQMIAFLNTLQHSDVTVEGQYSSVCTSLTQVFKARFPNCKVHRYGSTVTGLSFKHSDLDIYVDIGEPIVENEDDAKPADWTPKKVFKTAKSLLFKRKQVFTDIVLIPKAKTPIIKFRHDPTNIFCDISFKSSLGVRNSNFIKYYMSYDIRLKPLIMIIKFWAQLFGIGGTGKIANYSLTMLIIFFLQQPEIAIIPTIMELQSSCEPELVQGWQVNYDKNMKFDTNKNESSIPELLFAFFDFYAKFDFGTKVVCPLDGKAHTKTVFNSPEELPDSMFRYKEYLCKTTNPVGLYIQGKAMCIQDPIELSHNLTSGISSQAVEFFQQHCVTSRDVCFEARRNDYKQLFSILFTKQTIMMKHTKIKLIIKGEPFLKAGLPDGTVLQPDVTYRGQFTIESWQDTVLNLTNEFFERVLKLEVKAVAPDRDVKQQKCDEQSDVHSKDNRKIVLECSGFFKLWQGRKNKKSIFDPTLSMLDREASVSDSLIEELKKTPTSSVPILNFVCIIEKRQNPVSVVLTMENNNVNKSTFKEFSAYITPKLPHIVANTLLHMLQYGKSCIQSTSQRLS